MDSNLLTTMSQQYYIISLFVVSLSCINQIKHNIRSMGLLTDLGPIQNFQQAQKQQKNLKIIGIKQFLHKLRLYADWIKPQSLESIKWGEEIQGHFLQLNSNGQLQLSKESISEQYNDLPFPIVYEYGSWMFEIVPKQPHTTTCNFSDYVHCLRQKYQILRQKPKIALTIPVIPFMGVRDQKKEKKFNNEITQSLYIDDDHIADHPRFKNLTKNIRLRRCRTVENYVPIYRDINTDQKELNQTQPKQGFIFMDAMAFGMGFCCLQCTFSTKNFDHARYVYDQYNVLSPIFLALTAGTPIFKGKLSDWDVRWNVISGSVDDRTENQRNAQSPEYIPSSRYAASNYYIWNNPLNKPQYNDFYTGVRKEDIEFVKKVVDDSKLQVDDKLIFHLANIFRRDYLIVHSKFKQLTQDSSILFDMLNGTNWNSVRLKAPPHDDIGWLVEFRTMEVQLTADQNAAYSILIHLIARILHENNDINLYIPITLLRQNFERAHHRNALLAQKFYFRTNIYGEGDPVIEQLTIAEIMFGKGDYKGIFHEIECRLESCMKVCSQVSTLMNELKKFILETVTGKRKTLASWMRNYVNNHPDYTHNSILSKKVMDDMLLTLWKIQNGQLIDDNFGQIFHNQKLIEVKKNCKFKKESHQ